jgi:hypothetical protein
MRKYVSLFAAACLLITASSAAGFAICKTRKGGVFLRVECKKRETQLAAEDIGAKGDKGDPGPGLRVLDAAGKDVGIFTGSSSGGFGPSIVARQVQTEWFSFFIDSEGFYQFPSTTLYEYAVADCTGALYYSGREDFPSVPPEPIAPLVVVFGSKGYFRRNGDAAHMVTPYYIDIVSGTDATDAKNSCMTGHTGVPIGTPGPCELHTRTCVSCCIAAGTPRLLFESNEMDLTSLGLTPPFHLALQ